MCWSWRATSSSCGIPASCSASSSRSRLEELRLHLNDFRLINCGGSEQPLSPSRMRALHRQSWDWLRDELVQTHDGPTVVITHFIPSPAGIMPQYAGSNLNGYFVADCRELMNPGIALWIAGHTHGSFHLRDEASGVPLVCNPRGYQEHGRHENPDFDPGATFRVG